MEVFRKYLRELIKTNLVLDKLNLFFFLHQAKTIPFIFVIFAKNYILVNLFHIMRLDVPFLFYCCWFDFDFVLKDRVWGRQFSQSQFALFFFELHYPPFINPIITENAVFWPEIHFFPFFVTLMTGHPRGNIFVLTPCKAASSLLQGPILCPKFCIIYFEPIKLSFFLARTDPTQWDHNSPIS